MRLVPSTGWWFVAANGHEGWAPFSYLEPIKGSTSDSGVSGGGSEEEDTLSLSDSKTPSKYGMQTACTSFTTEYQNNRIPSTLQYSII